MYTYITTYTLYTYKSYSLSAFYLDFPANGLNIHNKHDKAQIVYCIKLNT